MQAYLAQERDRLTGTEQANLTAIVTKLVAEPDLVNVEKVPGNTALAAILQRMAIQERLPYLAVLGSGNTVLARTQPTAAFGDVWPVILPGISTGTASGLAHSEKDLPILISAKPIDDSTTQSPATLLIGIQLDQNYLTERVKESPYPLFFFDDRGITALAALNGTALNALSSEKVDSLFKERAGKSGSLSITDGKGKFMVKTLPITGPSGTIITTIGAAYQDTNTDMRLRLDLVIMFCISALVIAGTMLKWRRTPSREEEA
jgi:hypothetical protein